MRRTASLAVLACLALAGCSGGGNGTATEAELGMFQDQATDQVPAMREYGDDVFKAIATQVCSLLKTDGVTAAQAVGVMDNYSKIPADKRETVVGLAAGAVCPEVASKITGVGTPSPSATPDAAAPLRRAVTAYSAAFLGGDGDAAYRLLSERCKARTSREAMGSMTASAKKTYGEQPIKTLTVDSLAGDLARVTYTYSVPALNQTKEPWVREAGQWHEDDC